MRVATLSAKRKERIKRFSFISCIVASFFVVSACTNINTNLNRKPTSTIFQSDPNASGNGGSFQLSSVAPDLASPGTVYDLIGQNNEFDTYCGGSLGTCQCEYTFIQPGVGSQTVSSAVTYQESNLIRCPNSVPSGITTFDARVTVVAGGTATASPTAGGNASYSSNIITVSLSTNGAFAGSTSFIDLTNASSYVSVQRFQCRKRDFILNPMDNLIIDPFQSQDPSVIYPFNFYTTNVSESLLRMQQLPNQTWECSLSATKDRSLQWWANPNVFSAQPCTTAFCNGDGYLMYPTTTLSGNKIPVTSASTAIGKRRGTFSLSSIPYGVFQIPVKSAVAPLSYVAANYAIIGYGAKPIANTSGSSSCPAIALPPKATWVKLWNFRATDITAPKIVTSSQSITNAVVACDTTHGSNIFPSCEAPYPVGSGAPNGPGYTGSVFRPFGIPLDHIGSGPGRASDPMASRVLLLASQGSTAQTSACYNPKWEQWSDPAITPNQNGVDHNGQDQWTPSPFRFTTGTPTPIAIEAIVGFPFNIYQTAASWSVTQPGTANPNFYSWFTDANVTPSLGPYVMPSAAPADFQNQLTTVPLATDNFSDQLFITTDPSVDDGQMRNGSSQASQFLPTTYRSVQDCLGPTTASCTANKINWGVNVKEIGTPTSADLYPLCVLQFYD